MKSEFRALLFLKDALIFAQFGSSLQSITTTPLFYVRHWIFVMISDQLCQSDSQQFFYFLHHLYYQKQAEFVNCQYLRYFGIKALRILTKLTNGMTEFFSLRLLSPTILLCIISTFSLFHINVMYTGSRLVIHIANKFASIQHLD